MPDIRCEITKPAPIVPANPLNPCPLSLAPSADTNHMVPDSTGHRNVLPHVTRPAAADADRSRKISQHLDRLEADLAALRRQVQALQRMAALGTLSAMLAHEFNNLLTPVVSYSQYALAGNDPAVMKSALEKTHKNARRLSWLCEKLLGMAAGRNAEPAAVPLRQLLADAVDCLGRDPAKDNIEVSIDAADDLRAFVHEPSLQQVLFNLVINARQAMLDRGGRLSLAAVKAPGNRVRISVSDTGCGISRENLSRVFEPFFTTKPSQGETGRRGLGLGLHITRQLVEEQGGTILVESQPGKGTTFTFDLPAA